MSAQLGGSPNSGGTWSGPSVTSGTFDPGIMSAGIYTYTVNGVAPCANASAALTITVQQAPNAGVGGTLELCEGSSPIALINSLAGGPALNGAWSDPDGQPFAGIFTPGADTEGTYIYTVAGTAICADASASLEVNVMDLGLSGIDGPSWVDTVETLLYTALPVLADADSIVWSLPVGWTWDDPNHLDATAYLLPPAQADTVYICATAFGGGCNGIEVCNEIVVTVGLAELGTDDLGLLVYPNPNNGSFTVRGSAILGTVQAQLLDALGQQVAAFRVGGQNAVIELDDLPSGSYVLLWRNSNSSGSQRVIVAR
ncbi:MAG: T9SS type A sorting domain-containing protein [Flavobacteriales bacterium]|nr:T9SS type A sorting domain-containing protein [Flavobacteriales bacterium]